MRRPAEPLTHDEALALIDECQSVRDKAMLAILYRSGIRCAELLALRPHDVDTVAGSIRVLHGKGDKARVVGCDCKALALLTPWLAVRPDSEWLFCTSTGAQIQTSHMRRLVATLGHRAGIRKRTHCHGLRHSCASEMVREGLALHIVQAQLGHARASTTATYIARIAPEELLGVMAKRTW